MFREFTAWVLKGVPTVLAVGCLVICFGEIQTRLPFLTPRLEYQADRDLTGLLRPNQHGYLWIANQSKKTHPMTVNADSHRGENTDWSKPIILALGSSEAFGAGVKDSEVWTAVLEEKFASASFDCEVVNAAGPGMGAYQQDEVLRRLLEQRRSPDIVLVRISIGDRNFGPLAENIKDSVYQSSLRKKRIRAFTTFLPFLRNKIFAQLPSMRRACRLPTPRKPIESVYHDRAVAGHDMAEACLDYWASMIDRTRSIDGKIVFIVHAPHGYASTQVLYEEIVALCEQHQNASVMNLGSDIFGMEKLPMDYRGAYFRENFTLIRDPHANALQHKLTGNAVFDWLLEKEMLESQRNNHR